ncbi:MAG: aminopeptidase [Acidobacteriota bacterium]
MHDPRFDHLAEVLIQHSTRLQKGETVLIEAYDIPHEVVRALIRRTRAAGATPVVWLKNNMLHRELLLGSTDEQMRLMGEAESSLMSKVQAYIGLRGKPNVAELSDVPVEDHQRYQNLWWSPVHRELRVKHTKWVVLRWPDAAMAQLAGQSTEAFEDFYFDVCTLDYGKMSRAMQPLVERMTAADRVRLVAPGTDLRFSTRGIPGVPCDGSNNIPDGEVFTAPVRDSVEGTIRFNTPTIYMGNDHHDVSLRFEQGRIVEATSSRTEILNQVLDSDDGARYIGEFAIGFNPRITEPMLDILFDEKIAGSLHFTPGQCYDEAPNGNESDIHWDLVLRQTPETGGGEIWFDDTLIRKDGRFVVADLEPLNPEHLA